MHVPCTSGCVTAVLAEVMTLVTNHPYFVNLVTMTILVAGILVGVQTDNTIMDETAIGRHPPADDEDDPKNACDPSGAGCGLLFWVEWGIMGIFILELVLKFLAAEFEPWRALYSHWNKFDLVVVAGSFLPGVGSLATMLRLLRLLRVLKLVKSLPQLAVIVDALIMGFSSIGFIGLILLVFFYFFAIVGVEFFGDNDPWHFGTLHVAMLTLFRVCTGEDWTDVMYINIYGCKRYGGAGLYDATYSGPRDAPYDCEQGRTSVFAACYFIIFFILGSLVLLSSFIGRITTAMEEAQYQQAQEKALAEKVAAFVAEKGLSDATADKYKNVFYTLDLDGGGTLSEDELLHALKNVGAKIEEDELHALMEQIDKDGNGEVDLLEWLMFIVMINEDKGLLRMGGGDGGGADDGVPESKQPELAEDAPPEAKPEPLEA